MCGICGIFSSADRFPDQKSEDIVRSMMERLAHRGPDGEGYHGTPGAFVGHRRLAVIDLERGAQPMVSADGRYLLTFNGEIYNYIELRAELESAGVEFRTSSDTEVTIEFDDGVGPKRLLLSYAPLEKLG